MVGGPNDEKQYKSRVIYNSKVNKAMVEASLACKGKRFKPLIGKTLIKSRVFASKNKSSSAITKSDQGTVVAVGSPVASMSENTNNLLPQKQGVVENSVWEHQECSPRCRVCVDTVSASSVNTSQQLNSQTCPVYDVNQAGIEDKFTSALYNAGIQGVKCQEQNNCALFKQWQNQSDFQFGFFFYSTG